MPENIPSHLFWPSGLELPEIRRTLYRVAYRITGDQDEAEDLVQETLLKWLTLNHRPLENPQGYLVQMLINRALNQQRNENRRSRIRKFLFAEPELTFIPERIDNAPVLSLAVLAMLEKLNPSERAVMVLREAFSYSYKEIAEILGLREDHCRQLLNRAKKHLRSRDARFEADPDLHEALVQRLAEASEGENLGELVELLTRDAELVTSPEPATVQNNAFGVAETLMGFRHEGFAFGMEYLLGIPVLTLSHTTQGIVHFLVTAEGVAVTSLELIGNGKVSALPRLLPCC